jgi:hypothetical protein
MNQRSGAAQLIPATGDVAMTTDLVIGTEIFGGEPARSRRIGGTPALVLLASLIVSLLAASAAPTPLYALYQRSWHFAPLTTTIVFGVYAIAVLVSLLTFGRLSDYVGRRPVLLVALAVQVAALLIFASANDIDRERGTLANALSPGLGTGSGALLSAVFVQFLPAPTHLIYLSLIGVIAAQAVGIAVIQETVTPIPVTPTAFVPEVRLPRSVRGPVLAAAPVLFAVWALAGLYAALGPALVHALTGSASIVLGGASLSVLTATAVTSVYLLRNAPARTVMLVGVGALVAGVAVTLIALGTGSSWLFFLGTAISGIGFGSGFQGGIRTVVPLAAPHERAGVLSLLFVISYLGMGIPAVAAGFGATDGLGLLGSAKDYGVALIVLAALALAGLRRTAA